MFFGLCNSPPMFQTMINDILHHFIHNSEGICYMDDILIYSHTLSQHWQIIHQVLPPLQSSPSEPGPFHVECDASNFATGAVLSQVQAESTHQPVTFMSKGLTDVECNYQSHNKETVAIMHVLDEWHHFLKGMAEKFK